MRKKQKRRWSEAQRNRMMARVDRGTAVAVVAEANDISESQIYKWLKERKGKKTVRTATPNELPTAKPSNRKKPAKPLVATSFACPHCGGSILPN